ncbi:bifunctional riboflavin kinase/FAD synthetase [Paenibacillus sp. L3-i20]|uniref:bifunctional riboflavin kinase/FAD synthetase n=1 Tax=Paenibacillus sp. L3-i20 TaxID=2905833 RepID=UPI001EDC9E97|nr:bifunctional riboflavin kinase/FAD synthetase [Paenibacillus sp. L3-i20]GKU78675.1 riboflavin biosynthesis protein [Paenibacillus sp. L3-i20]
MEIIPLSYPLLNATTLSLAKPISIAIGHFDGVHRGHQNVVNEAISFAKDTDMLSAVLTFAPHPKEVLGHGDQYYSCLTPFQKKMDLFAQLGVDIVFVMQFDLTFAAMLPNEFVDEVLRPLGVKHAVIGFDFTFGSKGLGNAEVLRELGKPDIAVSIIEPLFEDGTKVSSTYTRDSLEQGNLEMVSLLLGRSYEVVGTVVHGDGRGRTIGFPTANLELHDRYVSPRLGVYAVIAWIDGIPHGGVLNHGMKPTFNKADVKPVMEAHLFNFDEDIYGKEMKVQFIAFIRPEQKFNAIADLIAQIAADSATAKELLGEL